MREQVEDVFLDWQAELDKKDQDRILYDEFDRKLQTVFVRRIEGFDKLQLKTLESMLKERVDKDLLVSSLVHT